jgi:RNA polymerase sigma-70 factor (ECF subfamily)
VLGDNFARTLAQVRNGDEAAFAALYRAHNPALAGFLRRRSITAAEDLASETWIGVARGLERFEGEESDFQRWLFTIARRRLVDHIRKVKRSPETTALAVDPSGGGDPLESVLSGELGAAALAAIEQLPPAQAEAVRLRIIGDLDVGATAAAMGRSATAVRILCHRGLKTLAEIMGSDGNKPDNSTIGKV